MFQNHTGCGLDSVKKSVVTSRAPSRCYRYSGLDQLVLEEGLVGLTVKAAVKFGAAGLVENSRQYDVRWLYGICTGDMWYVCNEFKREVIHSCRCMYSCICVYD